MALKDKIAVVTGGASGIGRAISLRLARDGANLAIWDRDISSARKVATEIADLGRRVIPVEVDVPQHEVVAEALADRLEPHDRPVRGRGRCRGGLACPGAHAAIQSPAVGGA